MDDKGPRIEKVPIGDLKPGPILHEKLSAEMQLLARYSFRRIGHFVHPTFEQWELGFLRDAQPQNEIALWGQIAMAWERYCQQHPDEDAKEVFGELVKLSLGEPADSPRQRELLDIARGVSAEDLGEGARGER